jgi:ABC-type transport system involved in cytochrome bd biosynthesis fused ATPase/permease subunit
VIRRLTRSAEWRFLASLWHADRTLTAAWWALITLRAALPALFAIAMGMLVGAVQSGSDLGPRLALAGSTFIAMNVLVPVHGTIGSILGAKTGVWLNSRLLRACVEPAGLAHLERPDLADEIAKARDFDAGVLGPPLEVAMPEVASGFATVLGGLAQAVVLGAYRWWAPLVLGGAWLSSHVLLRESALWKIFSGDEFAKVARHSDYAYRLAVDAPAAKEIRVFGLARWTVDRYADFRRKVADALYRQRRLKQRPLGWTVGAVLVGNAVVFWSLAMDARAGSLPLARLVVFAQVAVGVSALAFSEFDWWFRGSAEPIPRVYDLADVLRPAGALPAGSRSAEAMPAREIRFQHVGFSYPTTGVQVLDGFDLTIPAGTSLAIVGPNGAGKTTLAKLLCRLYDPQDGAVLVDGVDVRELDLASWRSRVTAVFQDFVRYELSLRENVAPLGAPDDVIRDALHLARAGDLAELDVVLSKLYDGGTDLSGGQWQRVALARAVAAVKLGAGVVILDEPTAQLDVRGEAEIFDRLLEATRGQTVVLISHRFSTVRHADRICVLEHGRVVELGSHDELMDVPEGRYRTMFELQASRFYAGEEDVEALDAV